MEKERQRKPLQLLCFQRALMGGGLTWAGGGGCPSLPDSQESKSGLKNGVHGTAYNGHREGGVKERKRKRLSAEGL